MNRLSFAFLLCLTSLQCISQNTFTSGYIVKTSGDTIRGFLQDEFREELVFQIKFKPDGNSSAFQTFTPSDIKAFKYESGNLYKAITFVNTLKVAATTQSGFALQLVEGTYNLFSYIVSENTYFVISGNGFSYFLYNSEYNNNGDLLVEGNYVSRLSQLANNCNQHTIDPEKISYDEKEIAKFIFDLNNCISPNTHSTNYYKKPKSQTQIVLFAGGLPLGSRDQITAEGMIRVSYPQLSKKISINIGMHYSFTQKSETDLNYGNIQFTRSIKDNIFCVPLTLQYNLITGIIQPYISAGFGGAYLKETTLNISSATYIPPQNKFGLSVICSLGIEGYITKRLFIKAEWRYELLLQYPAIGIEYEF